MFYRCVTVIILTSFANSSGETWLSEMISPKGWRFGEQMVFYLEDTKVKNNSLFDRIAIRVDYGDVGVSAIQKPEKGAVELDFYVKEKEEGRSKKMGNMMIPFLLGAAKASVMTMVLGTLKMMAVKSLIVAKVALILSLIILIGKFLKQNQGNTNYVEADYPAVYEHYPFPENEGYGGTGSYSAPVNTFIPYNGYSPSGAASALNYATLEVPANDTVPLLQMVPAAKRRDHNKRKTASTILRIRRYGESENGLI